MIDSSEQKKDRMDNKQFELYCPRCGSSNFYFRVKKDDYLCRKCGEAFQDDSQGLLIPDYVEEELDKSIGRGKDMADKITTFLFEGSETELEQS